MTIFLSSYVISNNWKYPKASTSLQLKFSTFVCITSHIPHLQHSVKLWFFLGFSRVLAEQIDVNKTSASKECDVCHYWYFLNYIFKLQPNVYNRCHDLLMMSINLSKIAILNIKGSVCCCIISLFCKNKTINLLQNADLTEKSGTL